LKGDGAEQKALQQVACACVSVHAHGI
jgi:hypothetical protein